VIWALERLTPSAPPSRLPPLDLLQTLEQKADQPSAIPESRPDRPPLTSRIVDSPKSQRRRSQVLHPHQATRATSVPGDTWVKGYDTFRDTEPYRVADQAAAFIAGFTSHARADQSRRVTFTATSNEVHGSIVASKEISPKGRTAKLRGDDDGEDTSMTEQTGGSGSRP